MSSIKISDKCIVCNKELQLCNLCGEYLSINTYLPSHQKTVKCMNNKFSHKNPVHQSCNKKKKTKFVCTLVQLKKVPIIYENVYKLTELSENYLKNRDTEALNYLDKSLFSKDETCAICFDNLINDKQKIVNLKICKTDSHAVHEECMVESLKSTKNCCPICRSSNLIEGKLPNGTMTVQIIDKKCEGFDCKTYKIQYLIRSGIQLSVHPKPNVTFNGCIRESFVPVNEEGEKILKLLVIAFKSRNTFNIGYSISQGRDNCTTWKIHHKTALSGGETKFGWPDTTYYSRLKEEVKNVCGYSED